MSPKMSKNTRLVLILIGFIIAMVAFTAGMVPLYYLFCKQFGIPVPTILTRANAALPGQGEISTRTVTIRFTANTGSGVPIAFSPLTYNLKVRLGEPALTAYAAHNQSPRDIDGVAVHQLAAMGGPENVDISSYVNLQQCFCFELQHYPGNKDIRLPLSFTISPELPEGIHTITFSYTLFEALPNDPRLKEHKDQGA